MSEDARILVVDDEEDILSMFRNALAPRGNTGLNDSFIRLERSLFEEGNTSRRPPLPSFSLAFCRQGEEAVDRVRTACRDRQPFAVVFLDIRLPPGENGAWTARQIRRIDPAVNIVIVTAFDDLDPAALTAEAGPADKILYLQKPVTPWEIRQAATALCEKWRQEKKLAQANRRLAESERRLEKEVARRTAELEETCRRLETEVKRRRETAEALDRRTAELEKRSREAEEVNIALKVLLNNLSQDRERINERMREMDENLVLTIKEISSPYFEKLEKSGLSEEQRNLLGILKKNLDNLADPAMKRLYRGEHDLTPAELQVANLVRQGKSNKEMAAVLNVSVRTIEFHRDNIRRKLGIKDRRTNLRTALSNRGMVDGDGYQKSEDRRQSKA